MPLIRIELDVQETATTTNNKLKITNGDPQWAIRRLAYYISEQAAGYGAKALVTLGAVRAAHTWTFAGLPLNNETCTLNGVTFTAKTSGATGNQFNIGADANATAVNFAAAVNASATAGITGVVTAAVTGTGVVTVYAITPGVFGNYLLAPTEALTNVTVSAWSGGNDSQTTTLAVGRV